MLTLTWCFSVGVAGFEPAASSSRSQVRVLASVQRHLRKFVGDRATRCYALCCVLSSLAAQAFRAGSVLPALQSGRPGRGEGKNPALAPAHQPRDAVAD
jgi:hypothetical protein